VYRVTFSTSDRGTSGGIRTLIFGSAGQGMITYLILEEQRRIDILDVLRLG
jgi:hypothetical protein